MAAFEDAEMTDNVDHRQKVRVSNQYHFMTDVRMQESPSKADTTDIFIEEDQQESVPDEEDVDSSTS